MICCCDKPTAKPRGCDVLVLVADEGSWHGSQSFHQELQEQLPSAGKKLLGCCVAAVLLLQFHPISSHCCVYIVLPCPTHVPAPVTSPPWPSAHFRREDHWEEILRQHILCWPRQGDTLRILRKKGALIRLKSCNPRVLEKHVEDWEICSATTQLQFLSMTSGL